MPKISYFSMLSSVLKNNIFRLLLILAFLFGGFFVFGEQAKAWTEPTEEPPGGNVAAPINVSSTLQTKQGSLTIGTGTAGVLKLQPKTSDLATPCNEGELYYRQGSTLRYCDSARTWQPVGVTPDLSKYFRLEKDNPPQESWGWLKGSANSFFVLKGEASAPTLHRSAGLEGWASDQFNIPPNPVYSSYGVVGYANANVESNYAVVGTNYQKPSAWAGYFVGNVGIEKGAGIEARLTLKPGVKLCFDNDCKSSWSEVTGGAGSTYWNLSGYDLAPKDNAYSLAVGGQSGDDTNTVFFVNTASTGSVVIGQPKDLPQQPPSVTLTCGDGTCNGQESGDSASANYCDPDCATVFTVNPRLGGVTKTTAFITWTAKEPIWGKFEYGKTTAYELPSSTFTPAALTHGINLLELTESTLYYFRVTIWDEVNLTEPRDTRLFTGSFMTSGSACNNNGVCETALGESCTSCTSDCSGKSGTAGGCSTGFSCCSDGVCSVCCSDANCSGGTPYCCGDRTCKACCVDANCPSGHCCSGQCRTCCSSLDCTGGKICCNGSCQTKAAFNSCCTNSDCPPIDFPRLRFCVLNLCVECRGDNDCGAGLVCCNGSCKTQLDCDTKPIFDVSLPLSRASEENQIDTENQGKISGAFSRLSSSLLIPEAKAQTELFRNIIPVAEAAPPFSTSDARKLSIYGGVLTIINGNASYTNALEIGAALNNGLGISSTDDLMIYADKNFSNPAAFYHTGTGTTLKTSDKILVEMPGGDTMTLGNAGRDIQSSGNIYLRPNNSIAASRLSGVSGQMAQNLLLFENTGVDTGGATLRVNNNTVWSSLKNGSEGDAIYAYANTLNAAVSAEQGNSSGWAGYFSGKVGIFNGNLDIGTSANPRQICWNNDCRSAWPSGTSYWTQNGNFLYANNMNAYVGIGTATPGDKLEVLEGRIKSTVTNAAGGSVVLSNPLKANQPGVAVNWALYNMTTGYNSNSLQFWAYDSQGCAGGMCTSRLTITDSGNVGIATQTPNAKLTVTDGTGVGVATANSIGAYNNSTGSALYAQQNNSSGFAGYFSGNVDVAGTMNAYKYGAGVAAVVGSNNDAAGWAAIFFGRAAVLGTGKLLGVGTINPAAKLDARATSTEDMDTISAISNYAGRSAVYAQQNNSAGYAGYFSGDLSATGELIVGGGGTFANDVFINSGKAWHSRNDGANSGLDADMLDGTNLYWNTATTPPKLCFVNPGTCATTLTQCTGNKQTTFLPADDSCTGDTALKCLKQCRDEGIRACDIKLCNGDVGACPGGTTNPCDYSYVGQATCSGNLITACRCVLSDSTYYLESGVPGSTYCFTPAAP